MKIYIQFTLKVTVLYFKGMHIFQFLEYLSHDVIFPNSAYHILRGHTGPIYGTCFINDRHLLSSSEDTTGGNCLHVTITTLYCSSTMGHAKDGVSCLLPWSQLSGVGCGCKVCLLFYWLIF